MAQVPLDPPPQLLYEGSMTQLVVLEDTESLKIRHNAAKKFFGSEFLNPVSY